MSRKLRAHPGQVPPVLLLATAHLPLPLLLQNLNLVSFTKKRTHSAFPTTY